MSPSFLATFSKIVGGFADMDKLLAKHGKRVSLRPSYDPICCHDCATTLSSGRFNLERSPQVVSAYRIGCGYKLQSFRGAYLIAYKICHKNIR
jgi:hypothetical protein